MDNLISKLEQHLDEFLESRPVSQFEGKRGPNVAKTRTLLRLMPKIHEGLAHCSQREMLEELRKNGLPVSRQFFMQEYKKWLRENPEKRSNVQYRKNRGGVAGPSKIRPKPSGGERTPLDLSKSIARIGEGLK